jgi:hypothetical protein
MAFRRRLILRIAAASPSRSFTCDRSPACAMSCLTPGNVRLAHSWSTASERPFLAVLPGSDARVPLLIRPYPPRHQTPLRYKPHTLKLRLYPIV